MNHTEKNASSLRIVFVGAVEEGRECLKEILEWGAHVAGIFTFNDAVAAKTSGVVSFDEIAADHGIPLYKIKSTNSPEAVKTIRELAPDVLFVIGWTRLVSAEILAIPPLGCIGMHASLLPRYRGRAPVNWVLINNEKETGNSAMKLDEGTDTGKVVAQRAFPISLADTCQTLYHKVAHSGRSMIREILDHLSRETLPALPQDDALATEMPRRRPEDGRINWQRDSLNLFNWVRAQTHPYPGAYTYFRGRKMYIWEARIAHYPNLDKPVQRWETVDPGTIMSVSDGIMVMTKDMELLSLHRLQIEGEPEMGWLEFVKSYAISVGEVLVQMNEATAIYG